MLRNCLTDLPQCFVGNFLSDHITIILYTKIQLSGAMFVQNQRNRNYAFLKLSGALLKLYLFSFLADIMIRSPQNQYFPYIIGQSADFIHKKTAKGSVNLFSEITEKTIPVYL